MKKETANKTFDEALHNAFDQYIRNQPEEEYDQSEFSDEHKQKMQALFEEVAKKDKRKHKLVVVRRVAVICLFALLIIGLATPKIAAWKEKIIQFIVKDEGVFSYVMFGDPDEIDSYKTAGNYEQDISFFGYLPEGYKVLNYKADRKVLHVRMENMNKTKIVFNVDEIIVRAIDTEDIETTNINLAGNDVTYFHKDVYHNYYWNDNEYLYYFFSDLEKEECKKIIVNIDIEKVRNILK